MRETFTGNKGYPIMARKRFEPEQIIHMLPTPEACRALGICEQTYYRWRKEYGGMQASQARKLRDLERENARLKKLGAVPERYSGSPWENGYNESFNGKLGDELLNGEIFHALRQAQILVERWRRHYNTIRPHSSLGYKPPAPQTKQSSMNWVVPAVQTGATSMAL